MNDQGDHMNKSHASVIQLFLITGLSFAGLTAMERPPQSRKMASAQEVRDPASLQGVFLDIKSLIVEKLASGSLELAVRGIKGLSRAAGREFYAVLNDPRVTRVLIHRLAEKCQEQNPLLVAAKMGTAGALTWTQTALLRDRSLEGKAREAFTRAIEDGDREALRLLRAAGIDMNSDEAFKARAFAALNQAIEDINDEGILLYLAAGVNIMQALASEPKWEKIIERLTVLSRMSLKPIQDRLADPDKAKELIDLLRKTSSAVFTAATFRTEGSQAWLKQQIETSPEVKELAYKELYAAIEKGVAFTDVVDSLVAAGLNINEDAARASTFFNNSIDRGYYVCVLLLLRAGLDMNQALASESSWKKIAARLTQLGEIPHEIVYIPKRLKKFVSGRELINKLKTQLNDPVKGKKLIDMLMAKFHGNAVITAATFRTEGGIAWLKEQIQTNPAVKALACQELEDAIRSRNSGVVQALRDAGLDVPDLPL